MQDKFAQVYEKLNADNKYWLDERFSIILQSIPCPTQQEVQYARALALECYFKMIAPK